jgi:hypothetical protein
LHYLAQQDGYWDKESYNKRNYCFRDRIIIKPMIFPGTTELIFRITLLDDNQQMAGSLVSLLKVTDPTGISQGSAGAVFLTKVSGDDKCIMLYFHLVMLQLSKAENI